MGGAPKLNSDVLDCVCQACPTSSLLVLSLVSSDIHALALPHLLHSVCLDRSPGQVHSFLSFITNNTHRAGHYVLDLEIDGLAFEIPDPDEEPPLVPTEIEGDPTSLWVPVFTRALALMPNLVSLTLGDKVEEIATNSSDFATALLSLPGLHSLHLVSIGHAASDQFGRTVDLKKDIPSLQVIDIVPHEDIEQLQLTRGEGMGKVLFCTREHLTQIGLTQCDLRDFLGEKSTKYDESHHDINTQTTFPNVVKLSLDTCKTHREDLAIAFPALHTLNLGFEPFIWHPINAPTQPVFSFPSLVSVTGRYMDVYSLLMSNNARDHVRRVKLTHPWGAMGVDNNKAASAFAVPQSAPFLKSFHFSQDSIRPLPWWQGFSQSVPRLEYLNIRLYVPSTKELDLLLVQIPQSLASVTSLEYISIVVEGLEHSIGKRTSPEVQASTTEQAIALSYAKNMPALKYIDVARKITSNIGAALSPTWWRVFREVSGAEGDFDVNVKALDPSQGVSKKEWYDRAALGV